MLPDNRDEIFSRWLNDYKNLIFKVVRAYADAGQDQDDLFQEILLQLWSSIPSYQAQAAPTTWIYRVALNTALTWKRGRKRRRKRIQTLAIDFNEKADLNNSNPTTDQKIIDQLYDAIRKLPKIDSSIILMHLDNLSYQEMAQILGISPNNVGVKLNRAKKQLAQLLKGLIDDF